MEAPKPWQQWHRNKGEHCYHSIPPQPNTVDDLRIVSMQLRVNNHDIWKFHKCKMCPYSTKSASMIRNHLKRHKITRHSKAFDCLSMNLEAYKCNSCMYRTPLVVNFNNHVKLSHGYENVKAENGGTVTKFPSAMMQLNWSNLRNYTRTYSCENCSFTTYSQLFYVAHYRTCKGHAKSFLEKSNKRRLKEQEEKIKWRKIKEKQRLEKLTEITEITHVTSKIYVCFMCDFETNDVNSLEKHTKAKHSNEETKSQVENKVISVKKKIPKEKVIEDDKKRKRVRPLYSCWKCPFSSFYTTGYVNHLHYKHENDTDINWIHCGHCSYKSVFSGHLKGHMRTKHPIKPKIKRNTRSSVEPSTILECNLNLPEKHISCDSSQKEENTSSKTETIREFNCTSCSFKSTDAEDFKEHILTNHVSTKTVVCFKCDLCTYQTIYEVQLMEHVLEHVAPEGLDRVQCEMCDVSFLSKNRLKKHIFNMHIL